MNQLILHLIGDYVLQSQWMAENKMKSSFAAGMHALTYSLPFLLLKPSWAAFAVILVTHFLIDRFSLAKYVVWLKNFLLSPHRPCDRDYIERWRWSNCKSTGYPSDLPPWLAVWLLIAADNTIHLTINYLALTYL